MPAQITPWPTGDRPDDWRPNSLLFEEVRLLETDSDDVEVIGEMSKSIKRNVAFVLGRLPDDAVVHPGRVVVQVDHNHLAWVSGTAVERLVNTNTNAEPWAHFMRVATSIYVEGMRVSGHTPGRQKLVPT